MILYEHNVEVVQVFSSHSRFVVRLQPIVDDFATRFLGRRKRSEMETVLLFHVVEIVVDHDRVLRHRR